MVIYNRWYSEYYCLYNIFHTAATAKEWRPLVEGEVYEITNVFDTNIIPSKILQWFDFKDVKRIFKITPFDDKYTIWKWFYKPNDPKIREYKLKKLNRTIKN